MSRFIKSWARTAALAMGVGVIGSLATAAPSLAVVQFPRQGANCQTDGKIDGAGSTLANTLQNSALISGYQQDVCGFVGAATNLNADQAGNAVWGTGGPPGQQPDPAAAAGNMIAYNWTTQDGKKSNNGSGQGLEAMQCRIDEFGGSDIPYTELMLTTLDGAPSYAWTYADPYQVNWTPPGNVWGGANPATCSVNADTFNGNAGTVVPPYPPAPVAKGTEEAADPYKTGYPNTADGAANMMAFPIGAGAAAIVANLRSGSGAANSNTCSSLPSPLQLTGPQLSDVMSGKYGTWAADPATSGWGCDPNMPIQRVVRQDSSGTTYVTMTYLSHVATGTLCDGTSTWSGLSVQSGTGTVNDSVWPNNGGTAPGTCSSTTGVKYSIGTGGTTITGGSSASEVFNVSGTPGAIGYGELANWKGSQAPTFQGNTVNGSNQVTINGTTVANPFVGEGIAGTGIPAGTTITAIANPGQSTETLTLSNNATATSGGAGVTLTLQNTGMNYVFLQAATGASFQPPGTGVTGPVTSSSAAANCLDATANLSASQLPGGGSDSSGPVGLDANGWAVDQAAPVPGDITYTSDQWPICTFTYDFAYTGFPRGTAGGSGSATTTTGPLVGITFDQERTLYSYFSYVLSPAAQAFEQGQGYQPVPASWLGLERAGFQNNF